MMSIEEEERKDYGHGQDSKDVEPQSKMGAVHNGGEPPACEMGTMITRGSDMDVAESARAAHGLEREIAREVEELNNSVRRR